MKIHYVSFFENIGIIFLSAHYHINRLYVTQKLNEAIDKVRKQEPSTFLVSPTLLSAEQPYYDLLSLRQIALT